MYINAVIKTQDAFDERDQYLNNIPAIASLDTLALKKPVTFLVGENGSGKSTLLEAIAVNYGFNPEGGSRNFDFHSAETHSGLHEVLRLSKGIPRPKDGFFLRAESFYNVATEVERLARDPYEDTIPDQVFLDSYGGKSLHAQSHGESFLSLMLSRFRGSGLYLLDEPEAALSPSRQLTLLACLHRLVKDESQFIIATHSPILMAYPNAQILLLNDDGLQPIDYKQTEHYQLTRSFLENPERMLRVLMED
jgi:predicted ATPase